MKNNRLSFSSVSTYTQCSRKFYLHYRKRLRSKFTSGALLMGSAIDKGINNLLETRNLEEAIKTFDKSFRYNFINNEGHSIPESTLVTYAKRDFDKELLLEEDLEKLKTSSTYNPLLFFNDILGQKEEKGWENLTDTNKRFYNLANWLSMRRKGHIMLKAYNDKILPKIKQVLAVQKSIAIENTDGDKITGFLDLAVEWEDGKRYLLDNKTSYMEYDQDSAGKSQQLILYYHAEKENFKLDGVGFIVLYKMIDKNRTKKCSRCGKNGTGQRHKTCDADFIFDINTTRCNGEWIETITPECRIDIILNTVSEAAENLVIQTFDEANEGIKKESFGPNLSACEKPFPCQFLNYCWKGKKDDLVKLESKKDEK